MFGFASSAFRKHGICGSGMRGLILTEAGKCFALGNMGSRARWTLRRRSVSVAAVTASNVSANSEGRFSVGFPLKRAIVKQAVDRVNLGTTVTFLER